MTLTHAAPAPLLVAELEVLAEAPRISVPVPTHRNADFQDARILVRAGGTPVGFIDAAAPDGQIDAAAATTQARRDLADQIGRVGAGTRAASNTDFSISVVLCTRNRPEGARTTIESLLGLRFPPLKIVVVDNAPDDDATFSVVDELAQQSPTVTYVREDRPGLAAARNRGVREAPGDVIAFTDDDVRVDHGWLDGVYRGLQRHSTVGCVTGIVASASLALPAERYFDRRVWWSSSCEPRLFTAAPQTYDSPLHPYASGRFGTGANFAMRRDVLDRLGGFDEALGTGTRSLGGEDLDMFVRVLLSGSSVTYEPSALVWHSHRVDAASLKRQMFGYGVGLSAYLTKYVIDPRTRYEIARRSLNGVRYLGVLAQRSDGAGDKTFEDAAHIDSRELLAAEARGLVAGPRAYLRARSEQNPVNRSRTSPSSALATAAGQRG